MADTMDFGAFSVLPQLKSSLLKNFLFKTMRLLPTCIKIHVKKNVITDSQCNKNSQSYEITPFFPINKVTHSQSVHFNILILCDAL